MKPIGASDVGFLSHVIDRQPKTGRPSWSIQDLAGELDVLDESKRQRAMRVEVQISRQALSIVQPINRRIADWQGSAARLAALGHRARITGRSPDEIKAEAASLSDMVSAEIEAFEECRRHLPPAIAGSARVRDTGRALDSMSRGLQEVLRTLSEGRENSDASPLS